MFKSTELITGFSLLVMFGALSLFGSGIIKNCKELFYMFFSAGKGMPVQFTVSDAGIWLMRAILQLGKIMLPILGAAFLAALVFNYLQVGFLFTTKPLSPKFSRISMAQGFKRIFSMNTLVTLLKSIAKVAIVGIIGYTQYISWVEKLPKLMVLPFGSALLTIVDMVFSVAFAIAIGLAILGPIDYLWEWWRHEKELRMSKQEIKDEYKLTEGNPEIKGRIKNKQREMSAMRIMQSVAQADVVITNPTHYAVALVYDEDKHNAPIVVAKGKDLMALRIREKAKELDITTVENKPLAQSLYFFCDMGDEVPEELYQAIAEILAYVYRLKYGPRGVKRA